MELKPMYKPHKDSPSTYLTAVLTKESTTMTVASANILPQETPYPLTIGIDKNRTEVVIVTSVDNLSNRLTIQRGPDAIQWPDQTKVARMFNAADLAALQENIVGINDELKTVTSASTQATSDISDLKAKVGDSNSGLTKTLADEIDRAKKAEEAEKNRAIAAEKVLTQGKIDKETLPQVITDWTYITRPNEVTLNVSRINAQYGTTTTFEKTMPTATNARAGMMSSDHVKKIAALEGNVQNISNLGGRYIGQTFATNATLRSYSVPPTVKENDYTYVIDDETQNGSTTMYVYSAGSFKYAVTVERDQVGVATNSTPGLVKGAMQDGKIQVHSDYTMSVVGWSKVNEKVDKTTTINGKPLSGNVVIAPSDLKYMKTAAFTLSANSWSGNTITTNVGVAMFEGAKTVIVSLSESANSAERAAAREALISPTGVEGNVLIKFIADGEVPKINLPMTVSAFY